MGYLEVLSSIRKIAPLSTVECVLPAMVERVPPTNRPGIGVVVTWGSRLPEGHAGASDCLGDQESLNGPYRVLGPGRG